MNKSPSSNDNEQPGEECAPEAPTSTDGSVGQRRTLGVRRPESPPDDDTGEHAGAPRRLGVRARFKPNALKPERKAERAQSHPAPNAKPTQQARVGPQARQPAEASDINPSVDPSPRPSSRPSTRSSPRPSSPPSRTSPAPDSAPTPSSALRATGGDGVRLSKVMSERGLCSRREADQIIERGWVFVDGRRVSELGTRIDPQAQIALAPEATRRQAAQVTILLHKPVGYVSGQPEPGYEPAVSLIGADNQFDRDTAQRFHASHLRGLAPAGRLDIDSTGLLVLTQNGRIARQLIGEHSKVDKEYIVRVQGRLDDHGLALLNHGLELDGRRLRVATVEWINDDQLRFVLCEGRKRQIRRMCELVGLKVVGLKRTRIGKVKLADLPLGEWRFLRDDESF